MCVVNFALYKMFIIPSDFHYLDSTGLFSPQSVQNTSIRSFDFFLKNLSVFW